ncbi:MAG: serpin family protein [Myxococcota bacterium]
MQKQKLMAAAMLFVASACGRTTSSQLRSDGGARAVESPPTAAELAHASNAFAFELWARLSHEPGNLAFSPLSIELAMALAWGGASGETAEQMRKVMHFGAEQDATTTAWGALARELTKPDRGLELSLANRLFGDASLPFAADYLARMKAAFDAPLESVDFAGAPEPARARINAWVADATEEHIPEILPPESITADTRLVLVDALYFHAYWESRFDPSDTGLAPFSTTPGTSRDVATMHQTGDMRVAHVDGAKLLELPYQGGEAAMLIVLPDAVDGLAEVERSLTATKLEDWRRALAEEYTWLSLPVFEIAPHTLALSAELKALGMTLPFDEVQADFTKIARSPEDRLTLGEIFHDTVVRVDETGTEAAATTAGVMHNIGALPGQPWPFVVDHPFLFAVIDTKTGLVLFAGHVYEPKSAPESAATREPRPGVLRVGVDELALTSTGAGLGRAEVGNVLRGYMAGINRCYQDASRGDPAPASLVLSLTIDATGAVKDAAISDDTFGLATFEECDLTKVKRWHFPKPADGTQVVVKAPLKLFATAPLPAFGDEQNQGHE